MNLGEYRELILPLITLILTKITAELTKKLIKSKIKREKRQGKSLSLFQNLVVMIIYIIGIGIATSFIPKLSKLSTSIFASSGLMAIVIGFASQQAFSNIVSGIFITVFKPFKVGDLLRFPGKEIVGYVEDITLRHTVIKNFENKRIIMPNSVISSEIIENANIIENKVCKFFEIGISYDANIDKAISIIQAEAFMHQNFFDNRTLEEKNQGFDAIPVRLVSLGQSSVNLKAWIWSKNNALGNELIWDLNYKIKKRFDEEGIEIPYNQQTIHIKREKVN